MWKYLSVILISVCFMHTVDSKEIMVSSVEEKAASFKFERVKKDKLQYLVQFPEGFSKKDKDTLWPMIVFLHGAGERGPDLEKVKVWGPPEMVSKGEMKLPFIILSPQCPEGEDWSEHLDTVVALIKETSKKYPVDKTRVYLTGISMGGGGTWQLAMKAPELFAAIAPVCGKGRRWTTEPLKGLPVWMFHGDKDPVIMVQEAYIMNDALKEMGNEVRMTIYPGVQHNSWSATYSNPELYDWFLSHKKEISDKKKKKK